MIKQKIDQCEFLVFLEILIDYILKSWAKPIEKKTPPKREVEIFWKDIWLQGTEHNATAPWIQPEYEKKKSTEWNDMKGRHRNRTPKDYQPCSEFQALLAFLTSGSKN